MLSARSNPYAKVADFGVLSSATLHRHVFVHIALKVGRGRTARNKRKMKPGLLWSVSGISGTGQDQVKDSDSQGAPVITFEISLYKTEKPRA